MELTVLDTNLEPIGIVDTFESLIWTDRYYGIGDCEIVKAPTNQFAQILNEGLYLRIKESEHIMIIEYINIHTDWEKGTKAITKGRSLESILERRIIDTPTILTGNFQNGILQLLNENAITPTDPNRTITRLEFEVSEDPVVTAHIIDSQFFGETLYDVIYNLCVSRDIGFKITLTPLGKFRFKLYAGADRSYDQILNPYVVFSPKYENLINADYIVTNLYHRTTTLVAGEAGVGNYRTLVTVDSPSGAGSDLARREMFSDAKDVTRNVPGGTLTEEEYLAQLQQRGMEDLANNTFLQSFEGQVDTTHMFKFGEDFFMGDVLQVANEYGHNAKSRVTEVIFSQDPSGIKIYPTFSTVN